MKRNKNHIDLLKEIKELHKIDTDSSAYIRFLRKTMLYPGMEVLSFLPVTWEIYFGNFDLIQFLFQTYIFFCEFELLVTQCEIFFIKCKYFLLKRLNYFFGLPLRNIF